MMRRVTKKQRKQRRVRWKTGLSCCFGGDLNHLSEVCCCYYNQTFRTGALLASPHGSDYDSSSISRPWISPVWLQSASKTRWLKRWVIIWQEDPQHHCYSTIKWLLILPGIIATIIIIIIIPWIHPSLKAGGLVMKLDPLSASQKITHMHKCLESAVAFLIHSISTGIWFSLLLKSLKLAFIRFLCSSPGGLVIYFIFFNGVFAYFARRTSISSAPDRCQTRSHLSIFTVSWRRLIPGRHLRVQAANIPPAM